jgi:hypothetical protein
MIGQAQASPMSCTSEDHQWAVDFNLEKDLITNIHFVKDGTLVKSLDRVEGISTRIFNREFFEFSLGGAKYFDFDRRVGDTKFEANFLLSNNPFRFEILVNCRPAI